jgi:hypothetical protein
LKVRLGFETLKQEPREIDTVDSVLIQDDFDNPIVVVQKLADGQICLVKASEPGFEDAVKLYGVGLRIPKVKAIKP